MTKREYGAVLIELRTLPAPGTILYPPNNNDTGRTLIRYEISDGDAVGVVSLSNKDSDLNIYWTLDQIRMCTFKNN